MHKYVIARQVSIFLIFFAGSAFARVDFVRDVKPILENHCVRCHGPDGAMRGIRLDRRELALMIVKKNKPDDSILYLITKNGIMPPGKDKVTPAEIEVLRKWITEGARWPKDLELVGKNPFLPGARDTSRQQ